MTLIKQTYLIELTPEDINLIITALHDHYMTNKEIMNEHPDISEYHKQHTKETRDLRDQFANITNRTFLGVDA